MSIDYRQIAPLVAQQQLTGNRMDVVFQCPVSGKQVQSSATVRQGMAGRAASSFKRNAMWSLRSSLFSAVRSVLGHGIVGRTASGVLSEATMGTRTGGSATHYSSGDRQAAIVEAYLRVQNEFVWDSARNGLVHSDAGPPAAPASGFALAIGGVQITERWDRAVLARMLAEIAGADGHIAPEERELFSAFGGEELGSIEQLLQRPPLNPGELGETSGQVRETLLMLAYAVAFADEELEANEQARLQAFAHGLRLSQSQVAHAARLAQEHVIGQLLESAYAFGPASEQDRGHLYHAAARIGLDQAAVQTLEAQLCKRKGLY